MGSTPFSGTGVIRAATFCLASLLWMQLAGCTPLNLTSTVPWFNPVPKPEIPSRMVTVWTHTVLYQEGKPGVRGFGGRIMFYKRKTEKPIAVDGTLTVYAFDATEDDPTYAVPERKFVFLPEQLMEHYSESKLGPSYSFWLPWDKVGGPQRQLSLVARFEPRLGPTVVADPSRQLLPGLAAETAGGKHQVSRSDRRAQRASYHWSEDDAPKTNISRTTTIDVPPNFGRHGISIPDAAQSRQRTTQRLKNNDRTPLRVLGPAAPTDSESATPASTPDKSTKNNPRQDSPSLAQGASPSISSMKPSPSPDSQIEILNPGSFPLAQRSTTRTFPLEYSGARRFPVRREPTRPSDNPIRRQPHPGTRPTPLPMTPRQKVPNELPQIKLGDAEWFQENARMLLE